MNKSLNNIGKLILKKKIYIILITIILAVTGVSYTLANVKYVATEKILLGQNEDMNLIETYKELVKSSTVLEKVITNTGSDITVNQLSEITTVDIIQNTKMIEIKVIGEDGKQIQEISKQISKVFIETVEEFYGKKELHNVDSNVIYYQNKNIAVIAIISAVARFCFINIVFCDMLFNG